MEIVPPKKFKYAHRIADKFTQYNPRLDSFPEPDVAVNLKECSLIGLPAVLWCAVYLSLWRQREFGCLIRSPIDRKVRSYLANTGLFDLVRKAGAHVDSEETETIGTTDTVLPITLTACGKPRN